MADVELDNVDYKIIECLRRNSRTPFTEIGKDLGVSDATVHIRVNRMLDEGVIEGFTVDVNEEALGRRVQGFMFVNVQPGSLKEVANQLVEHERVRIVYEIFGPNDLIVKVEANNLDEMRNLMLKIREIPNVVTSELTTIYKVWKKPLS